MTTPGDASVSRGHVDDAWLRRPVESGVAAGFGVYLHVPFCRHRCGYCDFAVTDRHADLRGRYAAALRDAVRREVARGPGRAGSRRAGKAVADAAVVVDDAVDEAAWPLVTSVYVGGGTPTRLEAADLASLLAVVRDELALADGAEVSIEANPEDVTPALAEALADAGATRVTLGVQSFAPDVLTTLERRHGPEQASAAVATLRAGGIAQVGVDLIYGTPGETDASWDATLAATVAAGPDHVSAYGLTIHANTSFGRRIAAGTLASPDDDVLADRFAAAHERLGGAGFEHYEVSNWARSPATRSVHNVLYWRHGDYLGLGTGAHGHRDGRRWWSLRGVEAWLADVDAGGVGVAGGEQLDADARGIERLMLGLRLRDGLHPHDAPPIDPEALADAVAQDLVSTACGRLACTDRGWYVLDEAVRRLA